MNEHYYDLASLQIFQLIKMVSSLRRWKKKTDYNGSSTNKNNNDVVDDSYKQKKHCTRAHIGRYMSMAVNAIRCEFESERRMHTLPGFFFQQV